MTIRALEPDDLDAVVAVNERVGWTQRRSMIERFLGRDDSALFVADLGGAVVGCGGATAFGPRAAKGPTGWIHSIVVEPPAQGRGLGEALTRAGVDWLAARGVSDVLLLATDAGFPIYRRLGFRAGVRYAAFDWPADVIGDGDGTPARAAPSDQATDGSPRRLRRARAEDMPAVLDLDMAATGEDRSAFLEGADATPWVVELEHAGGWRVEGFHLPLSDGGGPTIARDEANGVLLLDLAIRFRAPEALRPLGVPEDNHRAIEHLARAGLAPRRYVTRMWLGDDPPAIRPEMIWSVFNFAVA